MLTFEEFFFESGVAYKKVSKADYIKVHTDQGFDTTHLKSLKIKNIFTFEDSGVPFYVTFVIGRGGLEVHFQNGAHLDRTDKLGMNFNAVRILGGVFKIIKEQLIDKKKLPPKFVIVAPGEDRARLYEAYTKRILSKEYYNYEIYKIDKLKSEDLVFIELRKV